MKSLYFGDNLQILRESIADESVDLIYLDPPFNSKRDYNLLFKTPKGQESDAQITAFEDSWHWGGQAQDEFREIMKSGNSDVAQMMEALRNFLGENDMMAYLTMMANRLLELHRTLKASGSLFLHCDPTASHYLKIVLDGVFGKENFINEIVWKRSDAHNDGKQGAKHFGRVHDVILFYGKSATGSGRAFNTLYAPLPATTVENWYRNIEEHTGRRYNKADTSGPGGAAKNNPYYEWKGVARYWRYSQARMEELDRAGKLVYSKSGIAYEKRYLDESKGVPIQDFWDDVSMLRGISEDGERLGYPTQKPLALLERIISAASKEGDVVLDPFCGCGTALDAAQKLKRNWIGIDITHLAVSLIEKRLKSRYPELQEKGAFEVHGVPQDLDSARNLAERDKHQFQLWACSLVGVQPYKGGKKGADQGIDGMGFIEVAKGKVEKVLVSVKGGENVGAAMVRDLKGTVEREKAAIGLFVTLTKPTKPMVTEATSSGHYESPHHGAFPRIQILSIEGLLSGVERPQWPDMSFGEQNFKKARKAEKDSKQKGLFEE